MIAAVSAVLLLLITQVLSESSEDNYSPSHVNFNEIFTNSLSLISEDALTTVPKEDEFHLGSMPPRYTEFHRQNLPASKLIVQPPAKFRTPEPRFPTPSYLKLMKTSESPEEVTVKNSNIISRTTAKTTTTTKSKAITTPATNVLPIQQEKGILDMLFPAKRVKNFKSYFDSMKRVLSYTFR